MPVAVPSLSSLWRSPWSLDASDTVLPSRFTGSARREVTRPPDSPACSNGGYRRGGGFRGGIHGQEGSRGRGAPLSLSVRGPSGAGRCSGRSSRRARLNDRPCHPRSPSTVMDTASLSLQGMTPPSRGSSCPRPGGGTAREGPGRTPLRRAGPARPQLSHTHTHDRHQRVQRLPSGMAAGRPLRACLSRLGGWRARTPRSVSASGPPPASLQLACPRS